MLSLIEIIVCTALKKRKFKNGLTAYQVMQLLQKRGYDIDISLTVYLLSKLEGKGIVVHYENANATPRFEKYYKINKQGLTFLVFYAIIIIENKRAEGLIMKSWILKMENKVIWKYGFEHWRTIVVFKFTEILRNIIGFWGC